MSARPYRTRRRAVFTVPLGSIRVTPPVKAFIDQYADTRQEPLSLIVERLITGMPEYQEWLATRPAPEETP